MSFFNLSPNGRSHKPETNLVALCCTASKALCDAVDVETRPRCHILRVGEQEKYKVGRAYPCQGRQTSFDHSQLAVRLLDRFCYVLVENEAAINDPFLQSIPQGSQVRC